jgi:diadenosine tetraphosphate (Ap4A) HIT family hydrolase
MANEVCPFCNAPSLALIAENGLAFALRDRAPVRPLHTLIIPKRHIADIFEATRDEREAVHELAVKARMAILSEDPSVQGFNFGSNIGAAAGQVIFHAHVHLIPRRAGDAPLAPARTSQE